MHLCNIAAASLRSLNSYSRVREMDHAAQGTQLANIGLTGRYDTINMLEICVISSLQFLQLVEMGETGVCSLGFTRCVLGSSDNILSQNLPSLQLCPRLLQPGCLHSGVCSLSSRT